jgi:N-dimethylarginine dimethylaminohydrolase
MNTHLLMCDPGNFRVAYKINPYMHTGLQPNLAAAVAKHEEIVVAHLAAGRHVEFLTVHPACPPLEQL